jgi:RecB family endonuclease NucS
MDLYSIKGNKLNTVELNSFQKERDIQDLVEKNTDILFDVDFVCSEFKIGEFRIDTLCFDEENVCRQINIGFSGFKI